MWALELIERHNCFYGRMPSHSTSPYFLEMVVQTVTVALKPGQNDRHTLLKFGFQAATASVGRLTGLCNIAVVDSLVIVGLLIGLSVLATSLLQLRSPERPIAASPVEQQVRVGSDHP